MTITGEGGIDSFKKIIDIGFPNMLFSLAHAVEPELFSPNPTCNVLGEKELFQLLLFLVEVIRLSLIPVSQGLTCLWQ